MVPSRVSGAWNLRNLRGQLPRLSLPALPRICCCRTMLVSATLEDFEDFEDSKSHSRSPFVHHSALPRLSSLRFGFFVGAGSIHSHGPSTTARFATLMS